MKTVKLCFLLLIIPAFGHAFGFGGGGGGRGIQTGTAGNYGLSMADNGNSSFTCGDSIGHLFWESGVLKFCDPGSTTKTLAGGGSSLPSQTGNNGKYLTTNGTAASWENVSGSSSFTTAPTYSDQTCTAGQYAFDAGYAYFCRDTNTWDRIALAGWSNPSLVAPTFSSFTIDSAGTGLTAALSASTTVGSGGSGGLALTCSTAGAVAATYGSGSPGTSYAYTLSPTVYSGDTCTAAYTQPGNGLEGTTGGADVVTFSGSSVANNSTQTSGYADTFTGTDGTALSTHNSNWADLGDWPVSRYAITSNQAKATAWNTAGARYTASTSDISQIVQIASATVQDRWVSVRASASSRGYSAAFDMVTDANFTRLKINRHNTNIGNLTVGGAVATASSHTLKIQARTNGSNVDIEVWVDGVSMGVFTDTDQGLKILSGNPGFGFQGNNAAINSIMDDWRDN